MKEPRLRALLLVLALVGAPAVALRVACVGRSCPSASARAPARLPFCSLPSVTRALVANGFREGRSPDVLGTSDAGGVAAEVERAAVAWPSVASDPRVPIAFLGPPVRAGPLPAGTGLDQIAPTLANAIGVRRPFPAVRAGTAVDGAIEGSSARLVVELVWSGVGSADLEDAPDAWPWLRGAMRSGAATLRGTTGSLPLDPAATITTIGTGSLPSQHGITGSLVRNDAGSVVLAFGPDGPIPVLATLPDDLDHLTGQRALVGLVAPGVEDRGLIGGDWYVGSDRDDVRIGAADPVAVVQDVLARGYGDDDVPDVLGVVLRGSIERLDRASARIVRSVRGRVPGAVVAVAGTGTATPPADAVPVTALLDELARSVPGADRAVGAVGADGLFLDPRGVSAAGVGADQLAEALSRVRVGGHGLIDAYPAFAVSLARYCP